jgi:hypothetical protein
MQTMIIPSVAEAPSFHVARNQAVAEARSRLSEPVVISWRSEVDGRFAPAALGPDSPAVHGADLLTLDQWRRTGAACGGMLEIEVADSYRFIVADGTRLGSDPPGLVSVFDNEGNTYFCLETTCTEDDLRRFVGLAAAAEFDERV